MRKIEALMNKAILNREDWKGSNTEVVSGYQVSEVFLYGNLIARVYETAIEIFDGGGYQSKTTKSRLNAILEDHGIGNEKVYQKNGDWYLQMYDGTSIPFFSGMRLN